MALQCEQKESGNPAVSIVVPIYNGEAYLLQCLESLAAQEQVSLEIIAVDDGSTDGTGAILHGFEQEHPTVPLRVLSLPHRGASSARAAGIAAAVGEWIGFADADDWVEPEYFASLLEEAESAEVAGRKVDLICGSCIREEERDATTRRSGPEDRWNRTRAGEILTVNQARMELFDRDGIDQYLVTKLFRADRLKQCIFPQGQFVGEDFAVVCAHLERSRAVALAGTNGYHYRMHANNATRRGFDAARAAGLANYRLFYENYNGPADEKDALARYCMMEYMICLLEMYRSKTRDAEAEKYILKFVREHRTDYLKRTHDGAAAKRFARILSPFMSRLLCWLWPQRK